MNEKVSVYFRPGSGENGKISERRVQKLCEENRIPGAARFSRIWLIPKDAEKSMDKRKSYDWVLQIRQQCIAHNVHLLNACLSFLCKDREEEFKNKLYNDKNRFYLQSTICADGRYLMEWVDRLNQSMNYIEEHLTDEIDYEQLGRIACCSTYHYQRMFTYMAGITLAEYIRRRKMSLAAVDLQGGDERIIDIAEKYGYRSPTAFNRAFQSFHGIAPSSVKDEGVSVKSFSPIVFRIAVKGATEMNYRIETKEAFHIIGVSAPLDKEIEKNFAVVPKMWQEASVNGTIQKLAGMMDTPPMGLLGVSACNNEEQWKYFIAVSSTKTSDEFEEYTVPASTWAIFSGTGTNQSIQELEQRIITEWLPASGYEYANAPDIEVYLNPDPQNAQYEVWIPVAKKKA